ncbi:MAG: hypothetical protein U1D55_09145 [Phycisphaerae bacterium]
MSLQQRVTPEVVKPVAPEDVRRGDYLCILQLVWEHLGCVAIETAQWQPVRPVRVEWLPFDDMKPLRVVGVCLPFLLVQTPDRMHETVDVRRYRLARLPERFGRKAFKRLRPGGVADDGAAGD